MIDKIGSIELDKTFPLEPKIKIFDKSGVLIQSKTTSIKNADEQFSQVVKAWTKHLKEK